MSHFDIPNGSHSVRTGKLFVWNTTDGPGTTIQYKFQVGTDSGNYDLYDGAWKPGGPPGQWTDTVSTLPGNGHTFYVRAVYKKLINGVTKVCYTTPVSFSCNP